MRKSIVVMTLLISQLLPGVSQAQKKSDKSSKKGSATASYNSGIGIHLGDLTAFTFKKNMGTQGFEVNFGYSPYLGGYNPSQFFSYSPKFNNEVYSNGSFGPGVGIQFHYLFHYALPLEGLRWYWGVGPQLRARSYTIGYNDPKIFYGYYTKTGVDVSVGIDGVLGAEYKFKNLPIAVYADIVPYTSFASRFWFYPTGGIGARYTF
ncbi:MAG TPA: hypothetical protein VK766_00570 [Cytophagaceae bacterium]|jgi:hypothetical protein|nr:hypothetical protein [Cytophagaceae bacterium]